MCEYSFFAPCLFDSIKSKHDFYRGTDCMIKVCADLRKHATEIINYEKKENLSREMGKLNHIIIKKTAISAKRRFMMLMTVTIAMKTVMIAMMIVIMKNLMPRSFMVMLQGLMMLIKITLIIMMITVIKVMTKKIYGRKFRGNAMRFDYVDDSYNGRYDSN